MMYKKYSLDELAKKIREVNTANGWEIIQEEDWIAEGDAKYRIPGYLALLISEVSEALEVYRKSHDLIEFLDELADVQIRLLDIVGALTDDFDLYVINKIQKNAERGHKHGNRRV